METNFHSLPPLKRFRLMKQQQEQQHHNNLDQIDSSHLPAKKRKDTRNLDQPQPTLAVYLPTKKRIWALRPDHIEKPNTCNLDPPQPTRAVYLPAKKRIRALHPDHIEKPTSPIDLNVEYKPPFEQNPSPEKSKPKVKDDDDEDGIVCAICDSTDGDPTDPIVFCDGCDLMVHSSCYGYPLTESIPEGDWFCAQCLNKGEIFVCSLCPNSGGAMKPMKDGKWAHIVCALLVPEVFFLDPEGREGIDCSQVPKRRYEQRCCVCESSNGCAVDCSEPNCGLSFHVSCGFGEDLCIEYRDGGKKKGGVVVAFCKEHTELWSKQQQTGKFKIVARDEGKK